MADQSSHPGSRPTRDDDTRRLWRLGLQVAAIFTPILASHPSRLPPQPTHQPGPDRDQTGFLCIWTAQIRFV
uniref:Uncharacterized protein n=1 Tax=Ralstonia syzygii R24 TaxID=907261 RepID=G3AC53_9RALS|nr:hypothetical protein RALSY_mp30446 [Ralstonia syzygii R24]